MSIMGFLLRDFFNLEIIESIMLAPTLLAMLAWAHIKLR